MIKKLLPVFVLIILPFIFFKSFVFEGRLPIPSDTIVGLYYPFRDIYSKTNPNGIPFKNFLITDPVRQTYPWRYLSVNEEKTGNLPIWNPYNFAGTPLLANFQSAVFYPFNLIFFVLPFDISWSILVLLGPLLAGLFLYFYLYNLRLKKEASILGAIAFSFSGFFVAWMEWGTILSTALWLPLILLSIDKIFNRTHIIKFSIWSLVFLFSLISSFLAGHLQTFFYLTVFSLFYFIARWFQHGKSLKTLRLFAVFCFLFIVLTFVQWFPTIQFITLSARDLDVVGWKEPGWFIPWQNLIQFLAPDFFGNPATLNYWGIWNYGEFIGYVGIVPLVMAFFAMFFRKDKKTLFFGAAFFISLMFALPTIFAKIPFKFDLPLISTSQPTRLLFITSFSLSVLAAFGLDYIVSLKNKKNILYILGAFSILFISFWVFVLSSQGELISFENLKVAKQNLIFPSVVFMLTAILLSLLIFFSGKDGLKRKIGLFLVYGLIILTVIDLFRFGWKFQPFTSKEYLYPSTSITTFLQNQKGPFRVLSTDSTILPPNFSIMYKIQTLDGYDPLYLQRYGEFMIAQARGKPDISPPFGFNRIITPQNPSSRIMDLANVKYVLSLNPLKDTKLKEVFKDGHVVVYENSLSHERAFFVITTLIASSKQQAINAIFDLNYPLNKRAVVENVSDKSLFKSNWDLGKIDFLNYQENRVVLKTKNEGDGFLVFTDAYYPLWRAKIDGRETNIYITDYAFRGIIVPRGEHTIEFYNSLF